MTGAEVHGLRLSYSHVSFCDLSGRNLSGVRWKHADCSNVKLGASDLGDAHLLGVRFHQCPSLYLAVGLESIVHKQTRSWQSGSSLDVATVRACVHGLPDVFLEGLGYSREEITAWRGIYQGKGPSDGEGAEDVE